MSPPSTHVVLGGNGTAGRETVRALLALGETPTSVSRAPATVPSARSQVADLLDAAAAREVLREASVAYLTVGLKYSARIWAEQWPIIVGNTITACLEHGTHLVYLDNVYPYGRVDGPMTEQTPIRPASKKGEVRAAALRALDQASAQGLHVTIGRSADFYGPGAATSVFTTFALDRIAAGKDGTWFFDADQPHSLTYTPDIGHALTILGTNPEARGRVWHLPTAPALTGRQYVELAGGRTRVMGAGMMRLGALFNSDARETLEMAYQYVAPSVFDSTAFQTAFGVAATPVAEGIAATLASRRDVSPEG